MLDPFLLIALASFGGVLVALDPWPALASLGLVALALSRRVPRSILVVGLLVALVQALRAHQELALAEGVHNDALALLRPPARCEGEAVVESSPVVLRGAGPAAKEDAARVDVRFVAGQCAEKNIEEPLRARLYGAPTALARGDVIEVVADLGASHLFLNEGGSDPRASIARSGLAASGGVVTLHVKVRGEGVSALIDRAREAVRRRIDATYHPEAAPLGRALVLGEVDLPEDDADAFRKSGLSHLLAVSGTHLVVAVLGITAALTALLRRIERLAARTDVARIAAFVALPLAWLYADFSGGSGSALRAAGMLTAGMVAVLMGRRADGVRAFSLSLLVPVTLAPMLATDASFQLSAAATAGLLFLKEPLTALLVRGPACFKKPLDLSATTLAASLACTPVVLLMSPSLPALGVIANLVAAPIGEIAALPLCLAHAALGWAPWAERGAALVGSGALLAVRAIARVGGDDAAVFCVPPPSAWQLAVVAITLGIVAAQTNRKTRIAAAIACLFSIVGLDVGARAEGAPRGVLRVSVLDVAQGDGLLVDLPDGTLFVIDGGGMVGSPVDTGKRVLLPVLRARRRSHVDVVVLSHPHPDHFGGLPSLFEALPVRELWDSGQGEAQGAGATYAKLLKDAANQGTQVVRPDRLCGAPRVYGGATVEVLAPCPGFDEDLGANDNSLVLRIRYGERAVLLVGDAEAEEEARLVARYGAGLRADLLKVGHHGSRTSSSPAFLKAVAPQVAVISCGVRNRFGHPHPFALAALEGQGVAVARTDQGGELIWQTDGKQVSLWRPRLR